MIQNSIIAKRYACAFLNQYENLVQEEYYESLTDFSLFLKKNRWLYAYLSITSINEETKVNVIDKLHRNILPKQYTENLITLLSKDKRISLLGSILEQIVVQHRLRENIMHFSVTSAQPLSDEQQQKINEHLMNLAKNRVLIEFSIDPALIEGIRIQSPTLLWEHSIAQLLRKFNHSLLRQVHL
jgi:F-type H+-transporting ATPase subunit delta